MVVFPGTKKSTRRIKKTSKPKSNIPPTSKKPNKEMAKIKENYQLMESRFISMMAQLAETNLQFKQVQAELAEVKLSPDRLFLLENKNTLKKALKQSIAQYGTKHLLRFPASCDWVKECQKVLENLEKMKHE